MAYCVSTPGLFYQHYSFLPVCKKSCEKQARHKCNNCLVWLFPSIALLQLRPVYGICFHHLTGDLSVSFFMFCADPYSRQSHCPEPVPVFYGHDKPVSLVFYGVVCFMWVLWFWSKRNIKQLKPVAMSFIASVLLLAGYCGLNNVQNGYAGLTTVSHDNKFINIIYSDAYRELSDKDFVTAIDTTHHKGKYYTVFYLNNDHDKYQKSFAGYPLDFRHQHDMWGVYIIPPNELGYTAENIRPYLKTAARTTTYARYILKKVFDFASFRFFFITEIGRAHV